MRPAIQDSEWVALDLIFSTQNRNAILPDMRFLTVVDYVFVVNIKDKINIGKYKPLLRLVKLKQPYR